jgi:hypothetical protein
LCYYLIPFIVALALLGAYEVHHRIKLSRDALKPDEDEAPAA